MPYVMILELIDEEYYPASNEGWVEVSEEDSHILKYRISNLDKYIWDVSEENRTYKTIVKNEIDMTVSKALLEIKAKMEEERIQNEIRKKAEATRLIKEKEARTAAKAKKAATPKITQKEELRLLKELKAKYE